jgi:cytochrome c-type biogenesis protein CcmF
MFTLVAGSTVIYLFNPDNRKPLLPGLAAFGLTLVIAPLVGVVNYLFILFLATAAMAMVANLVHLVGFFPARIDKIGAPLTHFGFGIMLIGVMASSAFDSSDRIIVNLGETTYSEYYDVTVGYNGMVNEMEHPNNELLVTLDEGDGPRELRPQFYYSTRMDGVMRRPSISRSLGYDLYLAPQQIVAPDEHEGHGLMLRRDVPMQAVGLTFTLLSFEMGGHEDMGASGMSVTAVIEVSGFADDSTQMILPALVREGLDESNSHMVHEKAELTIDDKTYLADIAQISADQGIVVLDIPGLTDQKSDKLIIALAKKPLIVLVWIGTTLMMLGSLFSVFRRRAELNRAPTL